MYPSIVDFRQFAEYAGAIQTILVELCRIAGQTSENTHFKSFSISILWDFRLKTIDSVLKDNFTGNGLHMILSFKH